MTTIGEILGCVLFCAFIFVLAIFYAIPVMKKNEVLQRNYNRLKEFVSDQLGEEGVVEYFEDRYEEPTPKGITGMKWGRPEDRINR